MNGDPRRPSVDRPPAVNRAPALRAAVGRPPAINRAPARRAAVGRPPAVNRAPARRAAVGRPPARGGPTIHVTFPICDVWLPMVVYSRATPCGWPANGGPAGGPPTDTRPTAGQPPTDTRPTAGQPPTGHPPTGHPQGVALLYTTLRGSHGSSYTVGPPLAGGLSAGGLSGTGGVLAALACDTAGGLPGAGGVLAALACDTAGGLMADAPTALMAEAAACGGEAASNPAVLEPRHLYPAEDEVARRWWALPVGAALQLSNGSCYRLLFAGLRGTAAGPDVRDAVFSPGPDDAAQALVGDVEFHVRASDWFAHRHHIDARYNRVVLHVVLLCDDNRPTCRQDGGVIPTCSLYDQPALSFSPAQSALSPLSSAEEAAYWPCHDVLRRLDEEERARLLRTAGLLRFEQKVESFVEQLHAAERQQEQQPTEQLYDHCLLPALAEALAYGRDRAFFRAAVLYLLGLDGAGRVPQPSGRAVEPPSLDAARLHALRRLWQRAATQGATTEIRQCLALPTSQALSALRALFIEAGLSRSRADIVICNVVLPFAAALGLIESDSALADAARQLYLEHPGLPSNRVTRVMCAQLQLQVEPHGSCAQQGLHHIYQATCREKHCAACLAGKWDI